MTERNQIIEAMARAMDELPTASTMDRMGLARSLAVAALDAALPMLADEAFRWDTGMLAAEALRSLQEPSQ